MKKMDNEVQDKANLALKEILDIVQKHGLKLAEASGVMGAILGIFATQTEENFPLISFHNSFTRTYHANYKGDYPHHLSDEIKPLKEKNDH